MGQLILVIQLLLVWSLLVHQLFLGVPVLICEITVITVFTVKTFEKTQVIHGYSSDCILQNLYSIEMFQMLVQVGPSLFEHC